MDDYANKDIKITSNTISNYKPKFNQMNKRSFHTSVQNLQDQIKSKPSFSQLDADPRPGSSFTSLDIETADYQGTQIPIAVSIFNMELGSKVYLLDPSIKDIEIAIKNL